LLETVTIYANMGGQEEKRWKKKGLTRKSRSRSSRGEIKKNDVYMPRKTRGGNDAAYFTFTRGKQTRREKKGSKGGDTFGRTRPAGKWIRTNGTIKVDVIRQVGLAMPKKNASRG